ncbi:hypothetical protein H0H93_005662 [Arthromyces matolae]|nr:hypothetical protein H0H93_005662 [Arthromyces matolae]
MDYDSFDAVLHWIFRSTQGDAWFKPSEENISAGVCLRVDTGQFRVFPYENPYLVPFEAAVRSLNPLVAVKVRSAAVHSALATVSEDAEVIYIDHDTQIQVLNSVSHLPKADKEQCGAFIRDERVLIVWSDDLDHIVPLCAEFEEKIMKLVWRSRTNNPSSVMTSRTTSVAPSTTASNVELNEKIPHEPITIDAVEAVTLAKKEDVATPIKESENATKKWGWSWRLSEKRSLKSKMDIEKGSSGREERPIRLFGPFYGGLGLVFILSGLAILLQEYRLDNNTTRFALLIVANLSFLVGPVAQYHENSRYYSAIKPEANREVDTQLPHVTIEMPVYKESLEETIAPSVFSLKKAMQTYARQGGTSAIFIHDDGLQIIEEAERQKRIAFYADHNIGWVARPGHSSTFDGFKRAGRFKKASNMNYGLQLSLLMEKHILSLEASGADDDSETDCLEDKALELAVEETYQANGQKWRPWAKNARSIRMGEVVLIVDSDTIVPEDCLRDAARELAECPEVAIIQHESDVMQVAHHYFENGIAHFTRRINRCISMGCANGEVAPFVGHNAFLRWSAIQDAAFVDPADGITKIWSESNVSEDFDMALRLQVGNALPVMRADLQFGQLKGYIIRWATYSEGGFKEGVSLTVDDELNRWQKYSYGCNELIFNPLIEWWHMGPITKQLRLFLWSNAPIHYKITMMSYMFSYYGIAASAILSVLNYLVLGWALEVDGYYLHSFEIWLACTVVFPGAGNLGFTLLEYRLGHRDIFSALVENSTWIPFFFFFFGGLSIHLSTALLAHMFSYNITWGATKKEVERSNFWIEIPRIWKRFWLAFVLCFIAVIAIIILSTGLIPPAWRIPSTSWAVILPLAIVASGHILFPVQFFFISA